MKTTRFLTAAILFLGATAGTQALANGPAYDSSGNGNLSGTYYFRQVILIVGDSSGNLSRGIALDGSLVFDGNGNYTIPTGATLVDSSNGQVNTTTTLSGTYTLSASGLGYMTSPINGLYTGQNDTVYFTLSNGVLLASSTEAGYNDLLFATLQSSPAPSLSTFGGSWSMAGYIPGGTPAGSEDVFFQMNPNGAGSLGTVTVTGYIGSTGTSVQTQNSANVKYTMNSGVAVVTFPNFSSSTPFYSGQVVLKFSPDGNFVFGGTIGGFDMLVGVRNGTAGATQNFGGLYYQAGLDQDFSQYSSTGFANLDTYYGSLNASSGAIVAHERLQSVFNATAIGSTFSDQYDLPAVSPYNNNFYAQYAYGSNGLYRIGAGKYPYLGLNVAVQAPVLTGPGVFLNPDGIVNSASFAPFTAGVANGELITLIGSNLSSTPTTVVSSVLPWPTTLANVQVLINSVPAPIYYVNPYQIAVIVPYENPFPIAQIQVVNDIGTSNTVTEFVYTTTPGVFTGPPTGIGYARAVHVTGPLIGQLVTPSTPAAPGETIETFLTGLGTVYPTITPDGAAGPTNPLSYTVSTINADVSGTTATVTYAGLAPTLAGLYQVNVTIPTTIAAGDATLDISGPDSYAAQALIPVGGTLSGSVRVSPQAVRPGRISNTNAIADAGHPIKQAIPALSRVAR